MNEATAARQGVSALYDEIDSEETDDGEMVMVMPPPSAPPPPKKQQQQQQQQQQHSPPTSALQQLQLQQQQQQQATVSNSQQRPHNLGVASLGRVGTKKTRRAKDPLHIERDSWRTHNVNFARKITPAPVRPKFIHKGSVCLDGGFTAILKATNFDDNDNELYR
jgi:hypothetical protein